MYNYTGHSMYSVDHYASDILYAIINPQRACARVTVLGLCVCLSVFYCSSCFSVRLYQLCECVCECVCVRACVSACVFNLHKKPLRYNQKFFFIFSFLFHVVVVVVFFSFNKRNSKTVRGILCTVNPACNVQKFTPGNTL